MKKPALLFVNLHYVPDVAATGQHLADLAEQLADTYDVKVLCGRGCYLGGHVKAPRRERRNGVDVRRLRTIVSGRRNHALRLGTYALFYARVSAHLLFGSRDRHIVFLTTPPLIASIGYLASRLRGLRYAIWSMDLHPDAEAAAGMIAESGIVYRSLRRLNVLAYRGADFVVDLGPYMKERIAGYGVSADRLATVSIWSQPSNIQSIRRRDNPLVRSVGLPERTVVAYSGNAGIAHRFEEFLEAAFRLRGDDRLQFLFIGNGPKRRGIEQFVAEKGMTNFTFLPHFPLERLNQSLCLGDIHLVSLRREFAGIAVPAKLPGVMAAGRPVLFLGPARCESAESIRNSRCGVVIDPYCDETAVDRIVDTLVLWAGHPELRHELGMRGRSEALLHNRKEVCCSAFEDVIHRFWGATEGS